MPNISGKNFGAVERLRAFLERKRGEVRQRLSAAQAAESVQCQGGPLDTGDWCQKSRDEWVFVSCNRLDVELLRDLEHALRRLDEGSYGTCERCGNPIGHKRLEALPWAKCCVACQDRLPRRSDADKIGGCVPRPL